MKLTKPQRKMLERLSDGRRRHVGASDVRLHNTLARMGLAELVDDRGRPEPDSPMADSCVITAKGRDVLARLVSAKGRDVLARLVSAKAKEGT